MDDTEPCCDAATPDLGCCCPVIIGCVLSPGHEGLHRSEVEGMSFGSEPRVILWRWE